MPTIVLITFQVIRDFESQSTINENENTGGPHPCPEKYC